MAKSNLAGFTSELMSATIYKRNQGLKVRQATAIAIFVVFAFAGWELSQYAFAEYSDLVKYSVQGGISLLGLWLGFRTVNYPPFADFLVAVQAEVDKVSWPDSTHLYRATIVVLATMFIVAGALFIYDMIWQWFFHLIGFLRF